MTYFTLRLCSDGGAYEAIPRPRLRLNLGRVRRALEERNIPVTDARVLLIAQLEREVTISRDGRILIKCRDAKEAEAVFRKIQTMVGLPSIGPSSAESDPPGGTVKGPPDVWVGEQIR